MAESTTVVDRRLVKIKRRCFRRIIILVSRMKVENGIMPPRERAVCQVETVDGVIAVVETCPTPIEVKQVVVVITVEHVSMASFGTL